MFDSARRFSAGFTLLELMVAVAIVALMVSLAGPGMSGLVAAQRVRTMASDFHQELVRTRSEAIKRNVNVTLSPMGSNWGAGWSILDPVTPSGPVLDTRAGSPGVSVSTTLTQVVYRASGRITAVASPTFVFSSPSTSEVRCVAIDPSGRPYAKRGASC
ncbi:MAG: GspH/FimT family pseudopilin [Ramlibacter sp.]|nr:GspH/FimT family pseudopilin [Ramlibacter sp.]